MMFSPNGYFINQLLSIFEIFFISVKRTIVQNIYMTEFEFHVCFFGMPAIYIYIYICVCVCYVSSVIYVSQPGSENA